MANPAKDAREKMRVKAPEWKIFYSNKTSFDNAMGDPVDAPAFGVICIVFPDELVGRVIMHGWDWYYWVPSERQWWGSDIHGLLDRLLHNLEVVAVKQGRNVSNKMFGEIMGLADRDPDFPPKSGYLKKESPHGPRSTTRRLEESSNGA